MSSLRNSNSFNTLYMQTFLVAALHLPKTLKPLRSSDVGLREAAVSEDDQDNLILSTEAGVIIMTDLSQEILVPMDSEEVSFYDHFDI